MGVIWYAQFVVGVVLVTVVGPLSLTAALAYYIQKTRSAEPLWLAIPAYVFGSLLSVVLCPDTDPLKRVPLIYNGVCILGAVTLLIGLGIVLWLGIKAGRRRRMSNGFAVIQSQRRMESRADVPQGTK